DYIVNWLKNYANNAKVNGFVVGISGGIDSAVTSSLCARTGLTTLCVELPIHQAESQVNRANEHIKHLKKHYKNVTDVAVDLTSTFEEFKTVVPKTISSPKLDLALANTRARIRMSTLYYFAGLHGLLVAGTGNKVEDFGVGFFTKYGDGGVDLSPIADLLKSEVYKLATKLNVPESIQKAQPTDGLFGDSRTDEDQIGATYDELEWAMAMQAKNKNIEDLKGRKLEVYKIYTRLNNINQHKMNPIPVCKIPDFLK
ncbi:MAG TPA: NAD(+) synthase, partial [Tenacibaculum sp.]|nr:NAD(+) synthase [Tenacibaculum sp.]